MPENIQPADPNEVIIAKAKDFWTRYNKILLMACSAIILLIGGYFGYKKIYQGPTEIKAADYSFRAEEYYRIDSVELALNGDGQNPGFLKVITRYGGTPSGRLARFYAGDCYLKLGDNINAIKYLKDFSTNSKIVQARAYKLIADAYADQGKNTEAFNYYKKAASHFEKDDINTPEYIFLAAYFADKAMKNSSESITLYKQLKEKFPNTNQGIEAEKYLAQLGVYKED